MIQDVLNRVENNDQEKNLDDQLLLVHYNHNEAIWSDIIQKTPKGHFDKETGLRSYAPFGKMLKDPEAYNHLNEVFKLTKAKTGEKRVVGSELQSAGVEVAANFKFDPAPGDSMPEIQELARQGKKGDDLIVLMPKNMVDFLASQKGGISINPKTGYPQFWAFLAPLLGMIGGGLAAGAASSVGGAALLGALGGAGGSFLGSHISGKGGRHAGKAALTGGLGGALTGGVGHWMKAGDFNTAGGLTSSGAGKLAKERIAGGASSMGLTAAQEAAKAPQAAAGFDWGNLGKVMSIGSILPQFLGAGQEKKDMKKELARQRAEEEEKRKQLMNMNSSLGNDDGINSDLYTNPPLRRANPKLDLDNPDFYKGGRGHHWFSAYKTGGQIKSPIRYLKPKRGGIIDGHEKGQEDNVYLTVPRGTYIIDASTVSDIGDGNTKAGHKIWEDFIRQYVTGAPKIKSPHVKVALSAGEMVFPVEGVARIGGGDVEKGGHILDKMIKRIRLQKASKAGDLPPAALPLHKYLGGL